MIPLGQIILKASVRAGDSSGILRQKIINSINDYYQVLWNSYHWKAVTIINQPFTAFAGNIKQMLPADIDIIFAVSEKVSSTTLRPNSPYIYNAKYIGSIMQEDAPFAYTRGGNIGVMHQPDSSSVLTVNSSDASDIVQTVRIWGKDSSSMDISESVQLSGQTSISTAQTFSSVTDISKSDYTKGVITLTADTKTLESIPSHKYKNTYATIYLQSPPDKDYTLYVSGKKRFTPLLFNEDTPLFECENALAYYAYGEILQERGDLAGAQAEYTKAENIIKSLVGQEVQGEDREDTMPFILHSDTDTPALIS